MFWLFAYVYSLCSGCLPMFIVYVLVVCLCLQFMFWLFAYVYSLCSGCLPMFIVYVLVVCLCL